MTRHREPHTSEDVGYAKTAKLKVMAQLGNGIHRNERIVSVTPVTVRTCGIDEPMYIILTSSTGADENGRILLSFDKSVSMSVGGIFFVTEHGERKLQSAYLDSDMRGGRAMAVIVDAAQQHGITSAVGPFSAEGLKMVKRYGFKVVE
jgi:hypothetical protein